MPVGIWRGQKQAAETLFRFLSPEWKPGPAGESRAGGQRRPEETAAWRPGTEVDPRPAGRIRPGPGPTCGLRF